MRVGVVVALWGREAMTQLCLTRLSRAARGHEVTLVAVTDEPGNGSVAADLGFEVVSAPNDPLSDKHNAGALHLRDRVDAMMVMGSDDWICDRLFGIWAAELSRQPVVGVIDSWQVCTHRPEALYYPGYTKAARRGETIGTARALRSDVMDAVDWQPWLPGLNSGLDHSMTRKLRELGYDTKGLPQADMGVRVLGFKGRGVLTPFERFEHQQGTKLVPRAEALAPFPRDEREALAHVGAY